MSGSESFRRNFIRAFSYLITPILFFLKKCPKMYNTSNFKRLFFSFIGDHQIFSPFMNSTFYHHAYFHKKSAWHFHQPNIAATAVHNQEVQPNQLFLSESLLFHILTFTRFQSISANHLRFCC